jgi:hypothetical protein
VRASWIAVYSLLALHARPALSADDELSRAEAAARTAWAHHDAGDLRAAGEAFLEAYRLSKNPTQLWNAAKSLEDAGDRTRARDLWETFAGLEAVSDGDKSQALTHIHLIDKQNELEALMEATARAPPPEPQIQPSPVAVVVVEAERERWPDYLLMGAGAAALIAAGGLLIGSIVLERSLDADLAIRTDGKIAGTTAERANAQIRQINALRVGAGTAGAVGSLALAFGLVFFWELI